MLSCCQSTADGLKGTTVHSPCSQSHHGYIAGNKYCVPADPSDRRLKHYRDIYNHRDNALCSSLDDAVHRAAKSK